MNLQTRQPSAPFERALNFGLEQHYDFTFTLYLYMIHAFELKDIGIHTRR